MTGHTLREEVFPLAHSSEGTVHWGREGMGTGADLLLEVRLAMSVYFMVAYRKQRAQI